MTARSSIELITKPSVLVGFIGQTVFGYDVTVALSTTGGFVAFDELETFNINLYVDDVLLGTTEWWVGWNIDNMDLVASIISVSNLLARPERMRISVEVPVMAFVKVTCVEVS